MSYNEYDDQLMEEKSFSINAEDDADFGDDLDEPLDPLEGANDFPLEEEDEDPDDRFH